MVRPTHLFFQSVPAAGTASFARQTKSCSTAVTIVLAVTLVSSAASTVAAATYQPVAYSATAVLENYLYVYGGLTNLSSLTSYTSQFLTLPLNDEFDTDKVPWEYHTEGSSFSSMATAMALGSHSGDYNRFIVTGNRNNIGHSPAFIYDTDKQIWSPAADLPEGAATSTGSRMQDYRRDSPGVALDKRTGMLIEFGGRNATAITNEISLLDTNKPSEKMTWYYNGFLDTVPPLYAPILTHLPMQNMTVIMGGCDQMGADGVPTHCASFDTLYTLTSDSVGSAAPKATRVNVTGTVFPPPRVFTCTVMRNNNILMFGGGDPLRPLGDAWMLHTKNWTWTQESMSGFPVKGIMGHSCQLANYDQLLVVGGHNGDEFSERPLSVVKLRDLSWTGHYDLPSVSTGAKVGLGLSVVVVVSAIGAGLCLRRRRTKAAAASEALKKQQAAKSTDRARDGFLSATENNHHGRRRRTERSQSSRSVSGGDILPRHHRHQQHQDDGSEPSSPVSLRQPPHDIIPLEPLPDRERTLHGDVVGTAGQKPTTLHSTRSTSGSTSSTIIVEPTSPRLALAAPITEERQPEQVRVYSESRQQQLSVGTEAVSRQGDMATILPPTSASRSS
ncbi:hypothetical protein BGW39_002578 [Mortierella sp. 14UC]|nr:hypothetical protein BGW39_002578 [Mortierella sp. 14UC]